MTESFPVTELTWELETIFPGGISAALFDGEVRHVLELLEELGVRLDELPALCRGVDDGGKSRWRAFLYEYFEVYDRLGEVRAFASAHGAASGDLRDAGRVFGLVEEALAARSQLEVRARRFFRGIEERIFEEFVETSGLEELRPWLAGIREEADASMDPDLEELASALSRDGLHPWQSLYRRIAGDLIVRAEANGEVEELSLNQAGTIWKHPDAAKRQAVFEGLQHAWRSVAPICALALNAKVGMEQTLYERRGEGCLTRSLRFNRIEQSGGTAWETWPTN